MLDQTVMEQMRQDLFEHLGRTVVRYELAGAFYPMELEAIKCSCGPQVEYQTGFGAEAVCFWIIDEAKWPKVGLGDVIRDSDEHRWTIRQITHLSNGTVRLFCARELGPVPR